eukprot:15454101-Alexandrium_andersonii.AAC.1
MSALECDRQRGVHVEECVSMVSEAGNQTHHGKVCEHKVNPGASLGIVCKGCGHGWLSPPCIGPQADIDPSPPCKLCGHRSNLCRRSIKISHEEGRDLGPGPDFLEDRCHEGRRPVILLVVGSVRGPP